MHRPHENTYWLSPGQLLAGEHPVASPTMNLEERLMPYLECGVREFVDLTEPGEVRAYDGVLRELANYHGVAVGYRRFPVVDMQVPGDAACMHAILDHLDRVIDEERTAYVHCWGGIGRTGTVAGCYLVRHGLHGGDALARLAELWPAMRKSRIYPCTPQTAAQFAYVKAWPLRS